MRLGVRVAERYGLALLLLVVALVYTMAIPDGEWQRVGALALQSTALFATLAAAEVDSRILNGLAVLFVVALLAAVAQAGFADSAGSALVRSSVLAILLMSLPLVAIGVVRQVRADRKISVQTMMGVLCAYLLLMSSFAYAYSVIGEVGSEPFFSQGARWNDLGDYIYFSLITITTVGMGDLTPATDLGRSLTAAEALIGQIYMVTVVALIVANLGRTHPRTMDADESPAGQGRPSGTTGGRKGGPSG